MARGSLNDIGLWRRRSLTIPPNSLDAWIHLALWEIWMGMLLSVALGLGLYLIVTSRDNIITITDLTRCYAPPPVALPCDQMLYRGGMLHAAFTTLCGVMLVGVAAWFLWELWSAVEPKPINDDFLKLLDDSFGRDWRNPVTWPWARAVWAYGFTVVGATLMAGVGTILWTLVASSDQAKVPTVRIQTSQTFRLGQSRRRFLCGDVLRTTKGVRIIERADFPD